MSGFIGHLNVLIIRLSGRIEAMATAMFDNAGSPRRRDDAARDEFTAEFLSAPAGGNHSKGANGQARPQRSNS